MKSPDESLDGVDRGRGFRYAVYAALIVATTANMVSRTCRVNTDHGRHPMQSANDRSRWATVGSLVDHGTYAIDEITHPGGTRDRYWDTIDKVRHRGHDGREHYYSSKPPLLATLIAGKYWVLNRTLGLRFRDRPFYVVRILLVTTNVLPLVLYLVLLVRLVEQVTRDDWSRLFVVSMACWGTFLTTFAVTLNNHLPAAISVLVASYCVLRIWRNEQLHWRYFVIAGAAAAFAVANELPALSFCALVGGLLFLKSPIRTLAAYLPAAVAVAAAFFATNMIAHDSLRPPYAHRSEGALVATVTIPPGLDTDADDPDLLRNAIVDAIHASYAGVELSVDSRLVTINGKQQLWDPVNERRFALLLDGDQVAIHEWDNWYDYEGTYWTDEHRSGVDRGEPSRAVYLFHMLLGHRGVFSLTPVWLLSAIGLGIWLARGDLWMRGFAASVLLLSLVCIAFYVARPLVDRNYGGVACGFRWLFWFIPLWLICLVPGAEWIARTRTGRFAAWTLLLVSIASASYAGLNPWSHPWLYNYWTELSWIQY